VLAVGLEAMAQRISREEYIVNYKGFAVGQMERFGIPASITMAQALLESDNGNSRLAREGNNHFGIKCRDWTGATITHTDDRADECFRKYDGPEQSYTDHSEFLDNSPRYNFLFELDPFDYRGWAEGLRQAGYATDPNYGQALIRIIEENKLFELDRGANLTYEALTETENPFAVEAPAVSVQPVGALIDADAYQVSIDPATGLSLGKNNGVPYMIVRQGDSFASLARDLRINYSSLLRYNDLATAIPLHDGDAIYINKKKKRSEDGSILHAVHEGETMHSISQKYGIRLSNLYRLNRMTPGQSIRKGQQIRLR
jgi:LysM repeat protein